MVPRLAAPRLDDGDRARLGAAAGAALRAFAPLLDGGCGDAGLGVVACSQFDPALADAATRRVARPLAARGIAVPAADLAALGAALSARA